MTSLIDRADPVRALRRAPRRPVLRTPTEAMRTAPWHVGAVLWANAWEANQEGALYRWVIARHDVLQGTTEFSEGSERGYSPEARLVTDIEGTLGDDPSLSWIGVPASRLALFRQLEVAQLPATCGGEHNAGLERAVVLMQQRTVEAMRQANRASWPKPSFVGGRGPDRGGRTEQEDSPWVRLWDPEVSRTVPGSDQALIACDGSFNLGTGIGTYAAVSSDGSTLAATGEFMSSGDAELRAIVAGLELGVELRSRSFALVTDSLEALDRFERILHGGCEPGGASLRVRIRETRLLLTSDVTVHHVRRDSGGPLHCAADAIAFAVRRAATRPQETIAGQLERVVDEVLAEALAAPKAQAPSRSAKRVVVRPLP